MKNTKLLAEQYLFNTAARYFSDYNELDEKVVTDARGVKYDIPDDVLAGGVVTHLSRATQNIEDVDTDDDPLEFADQIAVTDDQLANRAKASFKAAGMAKNAERFAANTATENPAFTALIPAIRASFVTGANAAVQAEAIYCTGDTKDAMDWVIPGATLRRIQDVTYHKVILPAIERAADAKAGRAIRDNWEKYIGINAPKGLKFKPVEKIVRGVVTGTISESSRCVKDMCKAIDEALTQMYSERYNVSLSEANKMFIVNDKNILV